jgi:glycosyltransferase involved in cell wall biosynthesis
MIVGMMRIKNEARWIETVLAAAFEICDRVYILDDHSTDGTPEICRQFESAVLFPSPFEGLDESRDKNFLISKLSGDWCLAIDGDEVVQDQKHELAAIAAAGVHECVSLRVLYLWDRPDQVRSDGVYGRFWRPSFFRIRKGDSFKTTRNGGNFHCGNVPQQFRGAATCGARLLHFGYMVAADRRRKFEWYNQADPNNRLEDQYVHMVQGDPEGPSPTARLRHAGPLRLEQINA